MYQQCDWMCGGTDVCPCVCVRLCVPACVLVRTACLAGWRSSASCGRRGTLGTQERAQEMGRFPSMVERRGGSAEVRGQLSFPHF